MGIIRKTLLVGTLTAATAVGYLNSSTVVVQPLPPRDPLFSSKLWKRSNPNKNQATQDICLKHIPLDDIRPELLEREGDLVLEFCRGVWSSLGYEVQRRYLERKYSNESTATDLWSREQLAESDYEPGTVITDHFEVVERTPTSITVRCGDSPRNSGPRESDGLFTFSARIDHDRGLAELGLRSAFFNSARRLEGPDTGPGMGRFMFELHMLYSRLWMATGHRRVLR
ncbi:hypothetical protein RB601_004771 [Gaeumannomyces tritici]